MAISAINSLNLGKVEFRGTQTAVKKSEANEAKKEGFIEENKELFIGGGAVLAAALAAVTLHKTGIFNKIINKVSGKTSSSIADGAEKVNVQDRAYDGIIGARNLRKIQNANDIANIRKTINEFGPEGTRHAERIETKYEEALPEIFKEGANIHSREDILTYAKVAGLIK